MNGRLLRRRRRARCHVVGRLLQSYVDGETPDRAAFFVAAHLGDCPRCALDADAYRWLVAALARPGFPRTSSGAPGCGRSPTS